MIVWTCKQGIETAGAVEAVAVAHGFHCALSGSVLHKGFSKKDLDIIMYPHHLDRDNPPHIQPVIDALKKAGFSGWEKFDFEYDSKMVFKTKYLGGRVDFFFMQ